jgi:hypothetical protein
MRPDDLHQLLRERPFRPFHLHLSNGRTHEVRHPELVVVGRTTAIIGNPAPDFPQPTFDDYTIITLLHVNDVELLPSPAPSTTNGPGQ